MSEIILTTDTSVQINFLSSASEPGLSFFKPLLWGFVVEATSQELVFALNQDRTNSILRSL